VPHIRVDGVRESMNEKKRDANVCKRVHLPRVSRSFKHIDEDSNDPKDFMEGSGLGLDGGEGLDKETYRFLSQSVR